MPYTQIDRHNPSFYLFPINNNRTAWKPIGLPLILVAPHVKTADGVELENGQILSIRAYIEDVAQNAFVAGQDHILKDGTQLKYPAKELYSVTLTLDEIVRSIIKLDAQDYKDKNGVPLTRPPADGDYFSYTTGTGVHQDLPYYPDAMYYDLSDILIETEILQSNFYNLVYEAEYYARIVSVYSNLSDFICTSSNKVKSTFRFGFDHPGHVIHEMYKYTPTPYLTNANKSSDSTVEFYRPFSDAINDVYDEQTLLKSINWVNKTPLEMIPYLAFLLGWDLPYFPQTQGAKSLDAIRRAVIRNTAYFQNLKGSRKAIKEIFAIFGLDILVENLWWSEDGKVLIRPNQLLPENYIDQAITAVEEPQFDIIIYNYTPTQDSPDKIIDPPTGKLLGSFVKRTSNLLFIPQELGLINLDITTIDSQSITLEAAVINETDAVLIDGQEYNLLELVKEELQKSIDDPAGYGSLSTTDITEDGITSIYYSATLEELVKNAKYRSRFLLGGSTGTITNTKSFTKRQALSSTAYFDKRNNQINFSYDGFLEPGDYLFVWSIYKKVNIIIPEALQGLQSNRFDLQILTKSLQEQVDPKTLAFSLDFLYKLKAFHSLLNVVRTSVTLTENYECTDLKIGGTSPQRYDNADLGRLQVPPAILPNPQFINCGTPDDIGFKQADINLRLLKLSALQEEHLASYNLENAKVNGQLISRLDTDYEQSRLTTQKRIEENSIAEGKTGAYSAYGQDIITPDSRTETISQTYHPDPNANTQSGGTIRSDSLSDSLQAKNTRQSLSTRGNSSTYGSFTKETRSLVGPDNKNLSMPFPLQGFADYSYKGRINDSLLYRNSLENQESYRSISGVLSMGTGCYYAFPVVTKMTAPNPTLKFSGNAPKGGKIYYKEGKMANAFSIDDVGLLNRKISSLETASEETIHYHDGLIDLQVDQQANQAIQRPSLNIEKTNMHFPGCRFPTMGNLKEDYTTSSIKARPWDDNYACGESFGSCAYTKRDLNVRLITLTSGDQELLFDEQDYSITGNGRDMDITDIGYTQEDGNTQTVHAIYLAQRPSNYVQSNCILNYAADPLVLAVGLKMFNSAEIIDGGYRDILDGNPAVTGSFIYSKTFVDQYDEVLVGLGRPIETSLSIDLYYYCNTGILDGSRGHRLDGGSLIVDGVDYVESAYSSMSRYLDSYGEYDYSPDKVNMDVRLAQVERIGAGQLFLNGQLDNLASLI